VVFAVKRTAKRDLLMHCSNCLQDIPQGARSFSLFAFLQSRGGKPRRQSPACLVYLCDPCALGIWRGDAPKPMLWTQLKRAMRAKWTAVSIAPGAASSPELTSHKPEGEP
jgi:hypothetical protein